MKTLLIIDANLGQARAYGEPCWARRREKQNWKSSTIRTTLKWRLFSVIPSRTTAR